MDVRFHYPDTSQERYPGDVLETAGQFARLLFEPERLGVVVHQNFREFLAGKGLNLDGLEELQEYRRRFGHPVLHHVNFLLVPPNKATFRLGGPGQYTFDALMELNFSIPYSSLKPEWREGLNESDEVPVQLRMREPTFSRVLTAEDGTGLGVPVGRRMVFERSYWPYLVNRLGEPQDQIDHVGAQAAHYARHRTPMSAAAGWTSTWVAYNEIMDDTFASDPTVR